MLDKRPGPRYVLVGDHDPSRKALFVTISHRMPGIGKVVSCEFSFPRQHYEQVLLLAMLERASIH